MDAIFDNLLTSEYQQYALKLLEEISTSLQNDTESLAWFCGYMVSVVNSRVDNHQPNHPITQLALILILSGMQPFADFTPYPGCRLVITNTVKFSALPPSVKAVVHKAFNLLEQNDSQIEQMNNALLHELVISRD